MKKIAKLIIYLGMYAGIVLLILWGVQKHEINECYKWAEMANQYPKFYLSEWQQSQCNFYGVEVFPKPELPKVNNAIVGTITAYNSEIGQTDDQPDIMASGKKVYDGAIACPVRYKFGTKVAINDEIYTCEDRMAKRFRDGDYFDIWMADKEQAKNFGKKVLIIKILE